MRATREAVERWIRGGRRAEWIVAATGWTLAEVHALSDELGRCPNTDHGCGRAREGAGRARAGWVRVQVAGGHVPLWFCGWRCVARHASRKAVAA